MRIATFNVENLFSRPIPLNLDYNDEGKETLKNYKRINELLKKPVYTDKIKQEIEAIVEQYKLMDRKKQDRVMVLRDVRNKLWVQHKDGTHTWNVNGYNEYLGWVDLEKAPIEETATQNTAKVIAEVNADIQLLIEVENRPTLQKFHDEILVPQLKKLKQAPYKHILLIDGNDGRGIDVGLLSKVPVLWMKSHIEIKNSSNNPMFPRDCIEFAFELNNGKKLILFGNHFSSQASDLRGKRRKEQSEKVSEFVATALNETENVIVAGDLNENPEKGNLSKLINNSKLKDVMLMDKYKEKDEFPGTYQSGSKSNKLDYLLLSNKLQKKVTKVGVDRKGFKYSKWKPYDSVNEEFTFASDHHCVWVDINI